LALIGLISFLIIL